MLRGTSKLIHRQFILKKTTKSNYRRFAAGATTTTTPPLTPIGGNTTDPNANAPKSLTLEMAQSVILMSQMYVNHGLSGLRLMELYNHTNEKEDADLVLTWQSMMEAFLAAQVHTLAGFGYAANEAGLQLYNVQVAQLLQSGNIDAAHTEELRIAGRDLWRSTLSKAFGVSVEEIEGKAGAMDVPKARDLMHMVSSRMQEPSILEMIAQRTNEAAASAPSGMELNAKHTVVQRVLVNEVYLGGNPCLVEQCGFERNAKGYVLLQCIMAEHQHDPLIAQYIGGAMMRVLQSAGLDPVSLQKQ